MSGPLAIIAAYAVTSRGEKVIGRGNQLPWRIKNDLIHFKQLTTAQVVIMGRRTFASLRLPLPQRINIVVSRTHPPGNYPGYMVVNTIEEARWAVPMAEKIFIMGGAQIYKEFMPHVTEMYLTEIHQEINGDVYFPEFDLADWQKTIIKKTTEIVENKKTLVNYCHYTRS